MLASTFSSPLSAQAGLARITPSAAGDYFDKRTLTPPLSLTYRNNNFFKMTPQQLINIDILFSSFLQY